MSVAPAIAVGPELSVANGETLLPAESTPMLMHYLHSYVAGKVNKTHAVTRLLRCSTTTANRMLSRKRPYTAKVKTAWASAICAAVGKPLAHVLSTRIEKSLHDALTGWSSMRTFSEGMQLASDCAQAICIIARELHGFTGWYTLKYDNGGPTSAEINISPFPDITTHQIIITSMKGGDNVTRMFIRHHHPTLGDLDKRPLTLRNLKLIIDDIYALTKNLTADLKRELARLSAAQSRR